MTANRIQRLLTAGRVYISTGRGVTAVLAELTAAELAYDVRADLQTGGWWITLA